VEIEQGYLPGERLVERVRRITSADGVELVRTVKEGSGLTRIEIEEPVTPDVFARLWPLTEGRRLRKRRYRVPEGSLTWEIDRFLDRDLVLAEIELPSAGQADVEMPAWLKPHVEREVTEEEAYSNFRLAVEHAPGPTRGNGDRSTLQGVTNSDSEPPSRPAGGSQLREATQPYDDGASRVPP
jgi:CYTH domain-containing protein